MRRSEYIGSSDAIDIVNGLWDVVYDRKMNPPEVDPLADNFKVQLGRYTEPFHIEWLITSLCKDDKAIGGRAKQFRYIHPVGYVACHADGILQVNENESYPIEVKHSGGQFSMDHLVEFYMPQLQHLLLCSKADKLLFSVIQGNAEPEWCWIGASEEYHKRLLEFYEAFWDHIVTERPPERHTPVDEKEKVRLVDNVPVNGKIRLDMSTNNSFIEHAHIYGETKQAAAYFEQAKKELKAMMPADCREMRSDILTLRRSKSGSILFRGPDE